MVQAAGLVAHRVEPVQMLNVRFFKIILIFFMHGLRKNKILDHMLEGIGNFGKSQNKTYLR